MLNSKVVLIVWLKFGKILNCIFFQIHSFKLMARPIYEFLLLRFNILTLYILIIAIKSVWKQTVLLQSQLRQFHVYLINEKGCVIIRTIRLKKADSTKKLWSRRLGSVNNYFKFGNLSTDNVNKNLVSGLFCRNHGLGLKI